MFNTHFGVAVPLKIPDARKSCKIGDGTPAGVKPMSSDLPYFAPFLLMCQELIACVLDSKGAIR
jgi:hypothetical protein